MQLLLALHWIVFLLTTSSSRYCQCLLLEQARVCPFNQTLCFWGLQSIYKLNFSFFSDYEERGISVFISGKYIMFLEDRWMAYGTLPLEFIMSDISEIRTEYRQFIETGTLQLKKNPKPNSVEGNGNTFSVVGMSNGNFHGKYWVTSTKTL